MKIKSALFVSCSVLLMASYAVSDTIPPDPSAGVKGGTASTEITSPSFGFTLTSCTGLAPPAECGLFFHPQAIFAGDNDSGVPIGQLTLTLNFSALTGAETLGCDGGALFSSNNCATVSLPAGSNSATFTFFKGTGTGIGCYDFSDPSDGAANQNCANYTARVLENEGARGELPGVFEDACPAADSDDVCGSSHFVIGVGFGGSTFEWPAGHIPTGGTGRATPEPGTIALFVTGLGALAARRRALKK